MTAWTLYLLIAKWSLIVYGAVAAIWLIWKFACKAADFLSADEDPEKKKLAAQVDVLREQISGLKRTHGLELAQLANQHQHDLQAEKAKNEVFRALNPQHGLALQQQLAQARPSPSPGALGQLLGNISGFGDGSL